MTQRNHAGMRLSRASDPRKKDTFRLMQAIAAMLGAAVLILGLTDITGNDGSVMIASAVFLCIIYGILLKTGHENLFYIGTLIVMLVLILICRRQVLEGFRIFWNTAGEAKLSGTGRVLAEWELQLDPQQQELCSALFSGLLAWAITLLCCSMISFAPTGLAVLLPVILSVGMTVFGTEVRFGWMLPVLGVSVLLLIYSGWRKRGDTAPVVIGWGICAVAAIALIAVTLLPGIQSGAAELQESVHERIHRIKYETEYTTLPEGDFSDYKKSEKKVQAIAVTMDEPQSMYLRGFTGAEFDGESWKPLEKEVLAKNKQLHYWMNLNAFDQNAQFDAAAAYAGLEQSTVTVQNIGACSFYRYVPFSIGKGTWADPENLNTDGVYAAGERSYVYSVNGGSTDDILQVLTHLQTSDTPAVLQYRKTESSYRQFIKDYYLQVPEEVRELLQKQWDEIAGKYGDAKNLTLQQAQECTLIFLGQCFPEEGTPEGIELPLKKAEGTSFQYATVAAMTLRYFGIPARYAEGYVISEEMAGNFGGGETISVDSSCAKAWVEVYQDGIGWIPMNLTPGIGDVLQNQKNDNENSSAGMDITEKQDDEEQEEQERPEPSGGSQVTVVVQTVMKGILVIVAVLLLILLILWIRRKILLNRKEKKFRSGNISDAVAWIYADTALILEKLGFSRGNGSMRTLQKPLEERYGAEFASRFAEVSALNDRAMFSGRAMEEEQRTAALGFRDLVIQKLRSEMKWYKRMWLRWARCLY